MKYKILSLFLTLLLILSACGEAAAPSAGSESVAEPEAFGISVAETPEQEAEVTALPGVSSVEEAPDSTVEEADPVETPGTPVTDLTDYAIRALVLCDYMDGLSYAPDDFVLFWRAMGYYIDSVKNIAPYLTREDGRTWLRSEDADWFVSALFGAYDGEYPVVTEEDPFVVVRYEDDQEVYGVQEIDVTDLEVQVEDFPDEPAGKSVQAQVLEDGAVVATYRAELSDQVWEDGASAFYYSVTDLERE